MSYYTINIDDDKLTEQIQGIINEIFISQLNHRCSATSDVISCAVKDLIYSHKDEIIEKVVDRATKEIVRKGLPKLLERSEKQMTDKEIIEALECCASESIEACEVCPYMVDTIYCEQMKLRADALDLINRQQEQLEAAANGQETLQKALAEKNAEIERLKNNISAMAVTMRNCAKATRAEAIKEFVERLKEKSYKTIRNYGLTKDVVEVCDIDNLVKEMVGDTE